MKAFSIVGIVFFAVTLLMTLGLADANDAASAAGLGFLSTIFGLALAIASTCTTGKGRAA